MRKRIAVMAGVGGIVIGALGTVAVTSHAAPPPEKSSSRILLENDLVRVKEAIFAPNDPRPGMHNHDLAHVGVPLDDGRLTFNYVDGTSETVDLTPGAVGFREANVTHEAINRGDKPIRVIEVEIKLQK